MARVIWKHLYVHYKLLKKLALKVPEKSFRLRELRMRNRSSTILQKHLKALMKKRVYLYNGLSYFLMYIEASLVKSKLGEFVFTKLRGRTIHGELRASLSKKKGIKKKFKNFKSSNSRKFNKRKIFGFRISKRRFKISSRKLRIGIV